MPGQDAVVPGLSRRVLHRGRKFDFEVVEYRGSDGRTHQREIVRHPGAVVILPVLDDGRICLIRNYRPALATEVLELPAGTLEKEEAPEVCAGRELIEETGFRAATLTPLGRFYTSPGLSDELMWAFVARGLSHVGQRLEDDERLTVAPTPLDEVLAMIDRGELLDGKSIAMLLLARRSGLI